MFLCGGYFRCMSVLEMVPSPPVPTTTQPLPSRVELSFKKVEARTELFGIRSRLDDLAEINGDDHMEWELGCVMWYATKMESNVLLFMR